MIQTICTIGMTPARTTSENDTAIWLYTVICYVYRSILPLPSTPHSTNPTPSPTHPTSPRDQLVLQLQERSPDLLHKINFTNATLDSIRGNILGKGGFGIVYGKKNNPNMAVKHFQSHQVKDVLKEAILVSLALNCKITVNLEEGWITMPRFPGKELFDVVIKERECKPFDESELYSLGKQMLEQLVELHQRGIVHRDIKLENIMYNTDGTIRLIDFGLAYCQLFDNTVLQSDWSKRCGSWMYMPPEMRKSSQSSQATDIWCTAIMMIAAATANEVPRNEYGIVDVSLIVSKFSSNNWNRRRCHLSQHMVTVLRQMLEPDPKKRPPAKHALALWTGVTS